MWKDDYTIQPPFVSNESCIYCGAPKLNGIIANHYPGCKYYEETIKDLKNFFLTVDEIKQELENKKE